MNKKTKIFTIILSIVLLVVIIISLFNYFNYDKKIEKYIIKSGFKNNDISNLYSKQLSEYNMDEYQENIKRDNESHYEMLYFNFDTYELTKNKISYNKGISKDLTSTYDYTNGNLNYTYRINLSDTNIIIDGAYDNDTKNFTCEPTFHYLIDFEESKEDICNKIEFEINNFNNEVKVLFENPKLLDYMRKK